MTIYDTHIHQFGDDLRNVRSALLNLIAPILAARLPARRARGPETLTVVGNAPSGVVMHDRPSWQGTTRVTIDGDLITIDLIEADGALRRNLEK
jgi:hypothetical protein